MRETSWQVYPEKAVVARVRAGGSLERLYRGGMPRSQGPRTTNPDSRRPETRKNRTNAEEGGRTRRFFFPKN